MAVDFTQGTKMNLRIWVGLIFALEAMVANAGERLKNEVTITTGMTYSVASGSFYGAYNSADSKQYIHCSVGVTRTGSTSSSSLTTVVSCAARDAAGQYARCDMVAPPAALIDAVRSMSDTNVISFEWTSWECTKIFIRFPGHTTSTTPNPITAAVSSSEATTN